MIHRFWGVWITFQISAATYALSITNLPQFQELLINLKANYAHQAPTS